jgi:hypothetical protein
LSADACSIWAPVQNGIKKVKSLFAEKGNHFLDAKFSVCGNYVVTLCKDNSVRLWPTELLQDKLAVDRPYQEFYFPAGVSKITAGK